MIARRSFLQRVGLAAAGAAGGVIRTAGAVDNKPVTTGGDAQDTFRLGVAGYTFRKFKLEQALEMMKKADLHYLCIKDFHLPLASTDEEITAFHAKCRDFGVTGYGVGPIYMGSREEVDRAFAYAKRVGVKTLVGVPFRLDGQQRVAAPELLKVIHDKVQEHDIKFAIHNHGREMPGLYPTAESAIELVQSLDHRVGLCLDIAYQFQDGKDPARAVIDYASRLHDIHLKNVTLPENKIHDVELPRGAIDLVAFVRALRQVEYGGVCSLEYEKDMENPLLGIAESVGYFRGLMDATR